MTNSEDEPTTGISDDQLPDDLVPGDDNPLAEGLDPDEDPGDLFEGGKRADEQDDPDDDGGEGGGDGGDDRDDGSSS